jgi:glycerophosphoryl diester phosphodiesterase
MFNGKNTTVIFGHRGACALAPENTLSSFELAFAHLADAVELDAKLSKDNQVVVIHDQTVDRTTDGNGKVNALTLKDLKSLDAGSRFDKRFVGEKIPTLDEVFEQVGKKGYINVELTNYNSSKDALVEKVAQVVKLHNMESRVIFSSFLPKNLILIKKLLPNTPVGLLCLSGIGGLFSRSSIYRKISPEAIHPYKSDVTEPFVNREHEHGRRVHVWTVNEDIDLRRMFSLRVDGVFTDDPLKARKLLEQG